MSAPDWFPDWTNRTVAIAGCGPSLDAADLELCRAAGIPLIAVNHAVRLAPWADAMYACDWQYWAHFAPHRADFAGLRIRGSAPSIEQKRQLTALQLQRVESCHAVRCASKQVATLPGEAQLHWEDDRITNGGNGGLQAANLAARWGVRRVLLLGIDADAPERHFWGRAYPHHGRTPQSWRTVKLWRTAWARAHPEFEAAGVEVVNCNPASMFDRPVINGEARAPCYTRMPLAEALKPETAASA